MTQRHYRRGAFEAWSFDAAESSPLPEVHALARGAALFPELGAVTGAGASSMNTRAGWSS